MNRKEPIRVLVFGETGTGKTSLCNELTGEKKPVSDKAVGVTFQSQNYLPFIYHGESYIITDTVGLSESNKGTVGAVESFKNLLTLIKESKDGFNMIIHVGRGRITQSFYNNYKFFVEMFTRKEIPVIFVQTACENSEPMSLWVEENRHFYEEQGFEYRCIIATCFAETQIPDFKSRYDRLRHESKEMLLASIEKYALDKPKKIYHTNTLIKFIKRLWNGLCEFFDIKSWQVSINRALFELLRKMGFSEEEAKDITNQNG